MSEQESTADRGPKPSPLPWSIYRRETTVDGHTFLAQADIYSGGRCIAGVMIRPGLDADANATLIVQSVNERAALIEALKNLVAACYGVDDGTRLEAAIGSARAVLATAEIK